MSFSQIFSSQNLGPSAALFVAQQNPSSPFPPFSPYPLSLHSPLLKPFPIFSHITDTKKKKEMVCATKPILNSLSMATKSGCIVSLPSVFSASNSTITSSLHPYLTIPSKPIRLSLSCSWSYSLISLKSRNFCNLGSAVSALTAAREEDNTIVLGASDEELAKDFEIEEGYSEGEDVIEAAVGEEEEEMEGFEGGEAVEEVEEYQEPPEDAKLFVGNLPYDVDSEKLAQLFEQAGVVEIAEVISQRGSIFLVELCEKDVTSRGGLGGFDVVFFLYLIGYLQ